MSDLRHKDGGDLPRLVGDRTRLKSGSRAPCPCFYSLSHHALPLRNAVQAPNQCQPSSSACLLGRGIYMSSLPGPQNSKEDQNLHVPGMLSLSWVPIPCFSIHLPHQTHYDTVPPPGPWLGSWLLVIHSLIHSFIQRTYPYDHHNPAH